MLTESHITAFKATLRGVYHARIDYPAPAAGEGQAVAAALSAPEPLAGPMDGNAPPPEPLVARVLAKVR